VDHNVPTDDRSGFVSAETFITEPNSLTQCVTLEDNVKAFGVTYFGMEDKRQGIVHVVGPEQGFTLPGATLVCGDSHTATHGAFGALAFGIGTSEVEHVLATQTLMLKKAKNMRIHVTGQLPAGSSAKDLILRIIGEIGTGGGTGHCIEFSGPAIASLSMEGRMSVCNMAIEAGATAGMIAPDQTTLDYVAGRPAAPKGPEWDRAAVYWLSLQSDAGAKFDNEVEIDASTVLPTVTWGTSPEDTLPITGHVPDPAQVPASKRADMVKALTYMGLKPGDPLEGIPIDQVFIGSCTTNPNPNPRPNPNWIRSSLVHAQLTLTLTLTLTLIGSGLHWFMHN